MVNTNNLISFFYVRGYNPPYNEGHIVILNNLIKLLLLQNMKVVVFNNKYDVKINNSIDDHQKYNFIYEQHIPLIDREELFHNNLVPYFIYASFMEFITTCKFWLIEKQIRHNTLSAINLINCFRYPRLFIKKFEKNKSFLFLHVYSKKTISKNLIKLFIGKSNKIITSSNNIAEYINKTYDVNHKDIITIYPLIDTKKYAPKDKCSIRNSMGLKKSTKILLYLGNLRRHRFPENIILEVLKLLKEKFTDIKFLVYSPNNQKNKERQIEILKKAYLANMKENIEINVKNLSEMDKITLYSLSDVFIFPSIRSGETVEPPITILEAMSCGLPVISSDVDSINEIITNKINGLIIPFQYRNLELIADKVTSLLEDNDLRKKLSHNARQNILNNMSLYNPPDKLIDVLTNLHK